MLETIASFFPYLAYISITILLVGVALLRNPDSSIQKIGLGYLLCILAFETMGRVYPKLMNQSNLFVLSLSSFVHFAFLGYLYGYYFYRIKLTTLAWIIGLGMLLALRNLNFLPEVSTFNTYDRAVYSFLMMLMALWTMYGLITRKLILSKRTISLNLAVFIFFTIDAFLALPTNYLVNTPKEVVVFFWLTRALALQAYYIVLIQYLWQTGKIP